MELEPLAANSMTILKRALIRYEWQQLTDLPLPANSQSLVLANWNPCLEPTVDHGRMTG